MREKSKLLLVNLITIPLITAVFIYWLTTIDIDTDVLVHGLTHISIPLFLIAITCVWAEFVFRLYRFKSILAFYGHSIQMKALLPIFFVGFFSGTITPMRLGEPTKAILLRNKEDVPLSVGVLTTILDRVLEAVILVLILLVTVYLLQYDIGGVNLPILVVFTVVLCAVIILFIFPPKPKLLKKDCVTGNRLKRVKFINSYRSSVRRCVKRIVDAMHAMDKKKRIIALCLWLFISVIIILTDVAIVYAMFLAMGVYIPYVTTLFVVIASTLAGLITQTPGGMVSTEGTATFFYVQFGAPPEIALAAVLLSRAISYYLFTGIGWGYMLRERKYLIRKGNDG